MRRFQLLVLLVAATVPAGCEKRATSEREPSTSETPSLAAPAEEAATTSGEWTQFRGPGGLATSAETSLPESWGTGGKGLRWRTPLPDWGNSSPVAAAGKVFLTAAYPVDGGLKKRENVERGVVAFDLASGDRLWETKLYIAPLEKRHRLNTGAAPTPVWDGERLYAYFGAVLAALDGDGKLIWQHEIDPHYARHSVYGAASSPVVTESAVIVVQDREDGESEEPGWMAAFDKTDGKRLWRIEWTDSCCAYSTPLVVGSGADAEVVFAHSQRIAAYAARTGELLWQHPYKISQMVSSPSVDGDLIAVAGGAHNIKATHLLRRHGRGKATRIEVLGSHLQYVPQTSSPVLYKGLYFTVTDGGVLACYQAETGKLLWTEKVSHVGNRASLVAGDGKVYVFSRSGRASVVAAEPAFRLVATNDLGEELTDASPAISDGCLLLRGRENLICIGAET